MSLDIFFSLQKWLTKLCYVLLPLELNIRTYQGTAYFRLPYCFPLLLYSMSRRRAKISNLKHTRDMPNVCWTVRPKSILDTFNVFFFSGTRDTVFHHMFFGLFARLCRKNIISLECAFATVTKITSLLEPCSLGCLLFCTGNCCGRI
jgi:hypothetical protein